VGIAVAVVYYVGYLPGTRRWYARLFHNYYTEMAAAVEKRDCQGVAAAERALEDKGLVGFILSEPLAENYPMNRVKVDFAC
jgi:hypothetical protein